MKAGEYIEALRVKNRRLEGLVRAAHRPSFRIDNEPTFHDPSPSSMWAASCAGCNWNRITYVCDKHATDCPDAEWDVDEYFTLLDEAKAAHAAHVQALIDGEVAG